MRMPGFTAEASLETLSVLYQKRGIGTAHVAPIVPQLRSCIGTADGGQWCCVPGTKGPVCWKVPPPETIWTLWV